uniref:Uncharacterized protein n=1 Tax=Sphaerodactylus townsendi TaxID=933632 RepID=A0ACB8FE09_9SAUR
MASPRPGGLGCSQMGAPAIHSNGLSLGQVSVRGTLRSLHSCSRVVLCCLLQMSLRGSGGGVGNQALTHPARLALQLIGAIGELFMPVVLNLPNAVTLYTVPQVAVPPTKNWYL